MDSDAVFDKIIQNLEFEVEAVHQENTERFLGVENATPLNVKIRVRKKDETGVLHPGFISVPKFVKSNNLPNKIRLVNSDQTIVSFNLLMESDNDQNTITPSKRKHFFGVFKSGGCMDPQNDYDDNYSYMPSSSARTPKSNSIVINTSNYKLKIKSNGKNVNVGNSSYESKKTKRQKRFFGYCKPGGCLDPPFNEDQYSYKPSYLEQTTFPVKKKSSLVREPEKNKNIDLIDEDEWKASEQEKVDSKPIISIFHTDSMKISLDTAYSNSIITYPPTLSSSELYLSEKRSGNNAKNTNLSVKKVSKPSNEYNDKFFVPSKNNSIGKKTKEIVEVLRSTGLETVLPKVSKEKGNNANNDTEVNKEERNKKQNQHLNLLRSGTIQSDFNNLDLLTREARCSTRKDIENYENDRKELKNNSYELKNIPTKISPKPSFTHKVTSRSGQNISIGDLGYNSVTKSSKDVSKNKIDIHNQIKCSKLNKSLQIDKRSNNSVTNSDIISKDFTDSFTKTNIIEKKDSVESKDTIDPVTCIKNEEIREINHSSCFDSTAFKNEQGLDTITTKSTKRSFLASNSDTKNDLKNQDIKSSNDITVNGKHSYSDKKSSRVEEKSMVNSDKINTQINNHNKVIGNESKTMSDISKDFILLVPKNKSDHSNFKVIISDSSKAYPTSSDDLEKSKDLEKSNAYIEKESVIKERTFHNSVDSNNYLTKGKRQLTNSSSANSENLLHSVTMNVSPSMEPLSTQVIHRTESKTEYFEGESKCKERKSHISTDSNDYLSKSKSQLTNSCREDSRNLLDSATLNDNTSMEPLSTPLTHNMSTANTNVYVEKEPKIKEEMSHNSTVSHNYSTKSDRQLTNSSLRNSDSVTLNDNPSTESLSIPLSHNISTENENAYIEREPKIEDEISLNSNESHKFLNKSDRQLTSSSYSNSLNLLDSVILNERPLTEPLSIPLPHNILTENTSTSHLSLFTKNKSDDLIKQSKINVIQHQNHTFFNSSSNLDNHNVNTDITKINDSIDLDTKHYGKTNNQNKSSNNNRLEIKKHNYVSQENENEVSKANSSFKVHENDFEKPSENSLPVKDLKKLELHENIGTAMKLLKINENNQIFEKELNINHLYLEKKLEDSRSSTDSTMPNFIEESPNLKPNNKNSQINLSLNIKEKSEHDENKTLQAMDANPNEIIASLSKSISSDSQSSKKLLPPTSPNYSFNVEQVKNKSEELWGKLLDNDSKVENTQIENSVTKSDNIKYNANQGQALVPILSGDKFNNISKTKINLIGESHYDSFNRSGKSISSSTKIKKDIDRNEIMANSFIKTTTKYDLDSIDNTTKEITQLSHSFQSEKRQNAVFYDDASSTLKEADINDILNKDGIYVNNTLVRDTASIKHAVKKHSEILSEKHITDDKQCLVDSEPLWPNKSSIRQESLIELCEQNAISHHNLLNLISKERIKNSVSDSKFTSKSRIKSQIILDLGFQSYYDYAKNRKVLKSLDTSIENVRYPNDAVTVIKSDNLHDNEIKISVDSEMDMSIQILQKNKITNDEHQKANHNIQDVKTISKKNSINEDKNFTKDNCVVSEDVAQSYEITLEKTLNSVYEQQLIPLQDMIRILRSEIDNLAYQKSEVRGTVFKSHLYATNRTRSVRLIRTNKRCRCLKK